AGTPTADVGGDQCGAERDATTKQSAAQFLARPGQPSRHRAGLPAEQRGGLGDASTVEDTQDERCPQLLGQPADFLVEDGLQLAQARLRGRFFERWESRLLFAGPSASRVP